MGMFIYKDNMKFDIAIFAGGLGSRLKNTESRPKPLVDINGKSLLSRLIISLEKTNLFFTFHILTCLESKIFHEVLEKEIKNSTFIIYEEQKRSGRIGALKNFLNCNSKADKFFVCNGDTLFQNLNANIISKSIKNSSLDPIIFLANSDPNRNDYKKVFLGSDLKSNYQNSGLFFLHRKWFCQKIVEMPNLLDIDDMLFSGKINSRFTFLETSLLDAGTPERLSYIRSILD